MDTPLLFAAPPGLRAGPAAELLLPDVALLPTADLAASVAECRRRAPAAAVLPLSAGAGADDLLRFLRECGRRTAVFLYAQPGPVPQEAMQQALAAGARGFLAISATRFADDLCQRVTRLGRELRRRLHEDRARARLFLPHNLVGASPAMRDVFRRIIRANRFHDLPVLIEGEKGTPKRRLASAILYLDPTCVRMPYFALNCSELGRILTSPHPGTGASGDEGTAPSLAGRWHDLLQAARGGTVFLDQIESLDAALQNILLQAARRRPTEVRILAATDVALADRVAAGTFDPELAAWLTLFRIPLPSLRGRSEDIALQAQHVLQSTQTGRQRPIRQFEPVLVEALQRQPWDGNTRQLEAVLRQALGAKTGDAELQLADLPPWVREASADAPCEPVPHPGDLVETMIGDVSHPWDQAVDHSDRRLLATLLSRQGAGQRRT